MKIDAEVSRNTGSATPTKECSLAPVETHRIDESKRYALTLELCQQASS